MSVKTIQRLNGCITLMFWYCLIVKWSDRVLVLNTYMVSVLFIVQVTYSLLLQMLHTICGNHGEIVLPSTR